MPFHATVIQVLVASPGDTEEERVEILTQTSRWNGRHARGRGFFLSPWLYELHSTPILGDRPQAIINSQGVDRSDVVVAVFSARLGSSTGVDVSGTVEEINRAQDKGIPVHVYFSDSGLPRNVDTVQLEKLREFQKSLESQGLFASYGDAKDLARQVIEALEFDLDAFEMAPPPIAPNGVELRISHECIKEQSGVDRNGKTKYRYTARDLVVKNEGDVVAEGLSISIEPLDGDMVHVDSVLVGGWTVERNLPGHSAYAVRCIPLNGRANVIVSARWRESGEDRSQQFVVPVT